MKAGRWIQTSNIDSAPTSEENGAVSAFPRRVFSILSALILAASTASAFSPIPTTDVEQCDRIEAVVAGTVQGKAPDVTLKVSRWFKGSGKDVLRVDLRPNAQVGGTEPLESQETIFFLTSHSGRYSALALTGPILEEKAKRVLEVLDMQSNPADFLKTGRLDTAFAELLGRWFQGYSIFCPEIPTLAGHMKGFGEPFYEKIPWNQQDKVVVQCRRSSAAKAPVEIISAKPPGKLTDHFVDRLKVASQWDDVQKSLVPEFTVTLDARVPHEVKGISFEAACSYLHRCLSSPDKNTVHTALESLATMRDTTAVPVVLGLLASKDDDVRVWAIEFLGYSKDVRAIDPLCEHLRKTSVDYPVLPRDPNQGFYYPPTCEDANAAAEALCQIADPKALPALEFAAAHHVFRAGYALGNLGDKNSLEILLKAFLANPSPDVSEADGLYRLVRRSNLPVEDWMANPSFSTDVGIEKQLKWKTWWEANKDRFKIVRSWDEVLADL